MELLFYNYYKNVKLLADRKVDDSEGKDGLST